MTAELVAIREAINEIEENAKRKDKIVILTESLAASIALKNNKPQARQDLPEKITEKKIHILITTQISSACYHFGTSHFC